MHGWNSRRLVLVTALFIANTSKSCNGKIRYPWAPGTNVFWKMWFSCVHLAPSCRSWMVQMRKRKMQVCKPCPHLWWPRHQIPRTSSSHHMPIAPWEIGGRLDGSKRVHSWMPTIKRTIVAECGRRVASIPRHQGFIPDTTVLPSGKTLTNAMSQVLMCCEISLKPACPEIKWKEQPNPNGPEPRFFNADPHTRLYGGRRVIFPWNNHWWEKVIYLRRNFSNTSQFRGTCRDSNLISHTNPSGQTTIIPKPELLEVAYLMLGQNKKATKWPWKMTIYRGRRYKATIKTNPRLRILSGTLDTNSSPHFGAKSRPAVNGRFVKCAQTTPLYRWSNCLPRKVSPS